MLATLLASAAPLWGQDTPIFPETDFVSVAIDGSLNLRAGPTTGSERLTRLKDGTVLRRIDCMRAPDEDWCEVEALDGSIEGWAAARFLRPWYGADPVALESPGFAANERLSVAAPGRFAGTLSRGQVLDLIVDVPADREIAMSFETAESIGFAVFATDGSVIDTGRGTAELSVVTLSDDDLMIRFADVAGATGDWSLDVKSE
ncbi:SH3 domain-containing protein [Rhodovulum sp. YNF3179]|uniref:SH3 domain-containing protein n=1 Tax=Rhodovulum sp. YNF3179 TaxID=3425127 RepID=UPI003D333249